MNQIPPAMIPQLKSLELQGYKTFASKTQFEFPVRITAIVGPNGAGKSNIADSLRWVLGEQTYSLLRGKRTIDMIFAGSEQKPRASMAACKVTFDNSTGWLPIDYDEVAITRRAYRDGQNEYLLNGQRVRLKEINELLASAGLAERTYTIIGQGLVDSALSLRPEERRKFFEEASGIGLYQNRREESISRLEKTRRNLERVHDILGELEPRLKSLEKQAQRAREYERIQADLKILLHEWYGYHWHKAQKELTQSRDLLKTQETIQETDHQSLFIINNQVETFKNKLHDGRNSLALWRSHLSEHNQKLEHVNRSLAVLEERSRSLRELYFRTENDLVRNEEEHQANTSRKSNLTDEVQGIKLEKQEAEESHKVSRDLFLKRQGERNNLEERLNKVKQQVLQAETAKIQTYLHLQELDNQFKNDARSIESLNEKMSREQERLNLGKTDLEQINQQVSNREEHTRDLREHNHELEDSLGIFLADLNQLKDERSNIDRELTRLNGQIEVIEQAEKKFSGFNKGTRTILSMRRDGKLKGDFSVLGDNIEVKPGYEKVISAVLSEYIDAIIFKSEADPDQVLMILENEEGSQTYLIPDDIEHNPQPVGVAQDKDLLGKVSDFIKVSPGFENVVDQLIGTTYVVMDRKSAVHHRNILEIGARIATMSGEVFFPNGIILSANTGKEALVARPRQRRELLDKQNLLINNRNSHFNQEKGLEEKIQTLRSEKGNLEKTLRTSISELDQLKKKHREIFLDTEVLTKSLAFYSQQLEEKEQSVKNSAVKKSDLQKKQLQNEQVIGEAKLRLSELEQALVGLPIQELLTELGHWETNIAVLSRALLDLDARLGDLIKDDSQIEGQKQKFESMLVEAKENLKFLEDQKLELEKNQTQIKLDIESLYLKIKPMEGELDRLQKDLEGIQKQYSVTLQESSLSERHLIQAQMEMSRKKERLESLRKKIEDDFGLVEFEYVDTMEGPKPLPFTDVVEHLPIIPSLSDGIEDSINLQRAQLRRMGSINPDAQKEYEDVHERYEFLSSQVNDLQEADDNLRMVITELDDLMKNKFQQTFDAVAEEFKEMFTRLFGGGSASLVMLDSENPAETGIDIIARLPGRREQGLSLLSGGERSLTAVALIFALLKISPTPFCVLDEVDAMLDEANVGRFCELLVELSQKTQFVLITHNRNTVQNADIIYGVTMGRDSASQVISLKLEEVDSVIEK